MADPGDRGDHWLEVCSDVTEGRTRALPARVALVEWWGDLLALQADTDALVNPWNCNLVPRQLLLVGGVSGLLKKATGPQPWRLLARTGRLRPGQAVVTTGGRLSPRLVHVTAMSWTWRATGERARAAAAAAMDAAWTLGLDSIALPLLGAGHGGLSEEESAQAIRDAAEDRPAEGAGPVLQVTLVRYRR